MRALASRIPHGVLLSLLAVPLAAQAGDRSGAEPDSARVVDRVHAGAADLMIVTRAGDVALALAGDDVVFQLTDHGLALVKETSEEEQEDASVLAQVIGAMTRAGLARLLDHALAVPVHRIRRADFDGDRLILEGEDGELFDVTIDDRDVMTDFRPADARRLVREIRRLQER